MRYAERNKKSDQLNDLLQQQAEETGVNCLTPKFFIAVVSLRMSRRVKCGGGNLVKSFLLERTFWLEREFRGYYMQRISTSCYQL
jgi:hypothetical protein